MNRINQSIFAMLLHLFFTSVVFAQQGRESSPEGCGACAACGGFILIVPVVIFALNIALLVWVARDAKARGMDSSVVWMVLVMFTSVIGLIIYIFSRPQGNLIQCSTCGNNRLQASAKCPTCGNP